MANEEALALRDLGGGLGHVPDAECPLEICAMTVARCALVNEDVAGAAAAWLPAWGLPPAGVKDVERAGDSRREIRGGRNVPLLLPAPGGWVSQRLTKTITMQLLKRGAKIISVPLTIENYAPKLRN